MKIFGIGVDIVDNIRFKNLFKKKKFINRIFSQKELLIFKSKKNKILYLSKRFSAKEAFVKSLGTGFRYNLCFIKTSCYFVAVFSEISTQSFEIICKHT